MAAAISLQACSAGPGESSGPVEKGPEYPIGVTQSRVVDIQVFRDGTKITMSNTTPSVIPPSRLWINAWYSHDLDELKIGQTVTLNLRDFKDKFGDSFRAGGFFASRRPDTLVQAQLETGGEFVGLVVVGDR